MTFIYNYCYLNVWDMKDQQLLDAVYICISKFSFITITILLKKFLKEDDMYLDYASSPPKFDLLYQDTINSAACIAQN